MSVSQELHPSLLEAIENNGLGWKGQSLDLIFVPGLNLGRTVLKASSSFIVLLFPVKNSKYSYALSFLQLFPELISSAKSC